MLSGSNAKELHLHRVRSFEGELIDVVWLVRQGGAASEVEHFQAAELTDAVWQVPQGSAVRKVKRLQAAEPADVVWQLAQP